MLFTVASAEWSAGRPLSPADTQLGLFRTREAADRLAAGRPTLAVALLHDRDRGRVVAQPPAAHAPGGLGPWSAPAVVNDQGGVVVFAPVPAPLVRVVGPARLRIHPGRPDPIPGPRSAAAPALAPAFPGDRACGGGDDRVH